MKHAVALSELKLPFIKNRPLNISTQQYKNSVLNVRDNETW